MDRIGMGEAIWTQRLSRWSKKLGLAALVVALLGVCLARYDVIPKIAGLGGMMGGALLALIGTIIGLLAVFMNWRFKAGMMGSALIGLLLSGAYTGFIASRPAANGNAPMLHDISTDITNPPPFEKLSLRADNLVGIGTIDKWRDIHGKAYADLKSITIAKPVASVIANAEQLAKERDWAIAVADTKAGHLEATASVSFIRYQDDVIIRAVPTADGKGSIVDMRSVSRVGQGDFGVNAKRVREFMAALAAAK